MLKYIVLTKTIPYISSAFLLLLYRSWRVKLYNTSLMEGGVYRGVTGSGGSAEGRTKVGGGV